MSTVNAGGIIVNVEADVSNYISNMAKAEKAAKSVEQELKDLDASFKAGKISADAFNAESASLTGTLDKLKAVSATTMSQYLDDLTKARAATSAAAAAAKSASDQAKADAQMASDAAKDARENTRFDAQQKRAAAKAAAEDTRFNAQMAADSAKDARENARFDAAAKREAAKAEAADAKFAAQMAADAAKDSRESARFDAQQKRDAAKAAAQYAKFAAQMDADAAKDARENTRFDAQQKRAAASQDMADAKRLADAQQRLRDGAIAASRAANGLDVASGAKRGTEAWGQFNNKVMIGAQLLDDLQYVNARTGLQSVANNLVQLSPYLGVAAIAIQTLYMQWDNLLGLMGSGKLESEIEAMKRLGEATAMTADEAKRKREYDELGKGYDETVGVKTAEQDAQGKAVKEATKSVGGEAMIDAILQANPNIRQNAQRKTEMEGGDEPSWLAYAAKNFGAAVANPAEARKQFEIEAAKRREDRDGRAEERARQDAGNVAKSAESDPATLRELIANLKAMPDGATKFGDLIKKLTASLPENIAAKKKADEDSTFDEHAYETRKGLLKKSADEERQFDENAAKTRQGFIDKQAEPLSKSVAALAGPTTEAQAKAAMLRSGMNPAFADSAAADMAKTTDRKVQEDVAARALKDGVSQDEARTLLRNEAGERERAKDESRRDALKKRALELMPGADTAAGVGIFQQRMAGASEGQAVSAVVSQIARSLRDRGMSDDDASYAAAKIAVDSSQKVEKSLVNRAMTESPFKSEMVSGADLGKRLLTAGGKADTGVQQVELLQSVREELGQITQVNRQMLARGIPARLAGGR